ncbi:TetR/AcrR family transcriptional regulator [Brevundimonas sp. SORGH_AS_0993]|uniref:TetR/AcrR family transcriptional regulator n=1 Tax=Brevundimonas sp. SORGH_AS_0993 TaxID=3041794 RepID=UPI002785D5A5|nr:TetR/AcrR family transcriptional regulator [Brevundimonas sp. SORGH_AS_0993]MDQ1153704.1 AcrR family transcriptional regulator [Brevundimonas sp. SORGH_AS_0993]
MVKSTNKLGHRIGARGGRTRQAILDATRGLLNTRNYGDIRVSDLASAAGVSPSNFYTYFKTVEEPVLALCEGAAEDFQPLAAHFQADWPGDRAFGVARAFILDVMSIWRDHGQVLRVEHMLADNGEAAFVESRVRRLRRLHLAIERRVAQAHATGLHPKDYNPRLASYQIASIAESTAASFDLLRRADTPEAILDTAAIIIVKLTTGR